jgi:hypothetical protein
LEAAKINAALQSPVVYRADDLLSATILKGNLRAFATSPSFLTRNFYESINCFQK